MTLESQYNQFLKHNPDSNFSFNEWKQWHGNQIKQALIQMIQDDEELGLYDEPFKHKVEVLSKEEILANRSNAYEFIDFDKQETLEEVAKKYFNNFDKRFGFLEGAKWQQERSYSEEEVLDMTKQAYSMGRSNYTIKAFNEWFEQFKKK